MLRSEPVLSLKTADVNGYALHYAEHGEGAPLLLVHGSLCDSRYWKSQLQPLGKSFRVYALSLRRYWPERWDGEGGGFSIEQHVDDILRFIEDVIQAPAHLLGHSRGGRVALEAAQQRPDLLRSLILADPGIALPGKTDARGNFRQQALELIRQGDADAGLALFVDRVSGPDTWRHMVPWFKDMVRDNANTLLGQALETAPALQPERIASLTLPTLLIGGALSPQPYPAVLDALQTWLPSSQRLDIAGSSHGMNLGNPRAFNTTVAKFLSTLQT